MDKTQPLAKLETSTAQRNRSEERNSASKLDSDLDTMVQMIMAKNPQIFDDATEDEMEEFKLHLREKLIQEMYPQHPKSYSKNQRNKLKYEEQRELEEALS